MKRFIRGLHNMPPTGNGCVATIGSFDGVHRGHCEILTQLQEQSAQFGLPSVVMFFEPQPREYFSREQAPARLMRVREKFEALIAQGVDSVCCLTFNRKLRQLTAEQFIQDLLVDGLRVKSLVVGDDFRFGVGRVGDYKLLEQFGRQQGFNVLATRTIEYQGERISSTRIREALNHDDFALADKLLGRPFSIKGRVAKGQRLGTQLGVPTANLILHRYAVPISGVYAVMVTLPDGSLIKGVANVGVRPTVEDRVRPILEVHLLDFNQDIYGQRITVKPLAKIRDEKKFASLEVLKQAMNDDINWAKNYFRTANETATIGSAKSGISENP